MKEKQRWFVLGFITAIVIISAINYYRTRPGNAVETWPKENQEAMIDMYPWIKSVRAYKAGAFNLIVPANSKEKSDAIISPNNNYPVIFVSDHYIDIADSKHNSISIRYNKSDGIYNSYRFATSGITQTDYNLDGQFDTKIGPGKNVAVYYNNAWFPVIFKDAKKYIEVNGIEKEIKLPPGAIWKFVEQ